MDKNEFVTYNNLFWLTTYELLEIFFCSSNSTLVNMAKSILINDERLLDDGINELVISQFLNNILLEDCWALATIDKEYLINRLARKKVFNVVDESFKKSFLKVVK